MADSSRRTDDHAGATVRTEVTYLRVMLELSHPSLEPEEVTEALGVRPSESWRKGETAVVLGGRRQLTRPSGIWRLTCPVDATDMALMDRMVVQMRWLLAQVLPNWDGVRARYPDIEVGVCVGITCRDLERDYGPHLPADCIKAAAAIGASIDFDVYELTE